VLRFDGGGEEGGPGAAMEREPRGKYECKLFILKQSAAKPEKTQKPNQYGALLNLTD